MGILSMISARNLHAPAISLPSERFRGRDKGAAHTLPLVPWHNRQRSYASEIPGCVEERNEMHAYHAYDSNGGILGNQHSIRGAPQRR